MKPMAPSVQPRHDGVSSNGNNDVEYADVKWEELGFNLTSTDYMYVMKCSVGENFCHGSITPYGNIELSPCSSVLNYGQAIFEGLKAYRKEDGKILIFRPEENAMRMKLGAERMCMPSPSIEQFVDAVKRTVLANERWVPPPGKGSMYLRPILMGSGASLGVGPSPEYTFLVYASPVGNYHKGQSRLNLLIEENQHRAMVGGTGGVKAIGNYAPVMQSLTRAKAEGFSDVLFLDAATGKYIEEASACNVFVLRGNVILTPEAHGTVLPGITRKSIMELARMFGFEVKEGPVPLEALEGADEIFCTGTAVVVTPVGSITHRDKTIKYEAKTESLCQKLHATLTGIQAGRIEDKMGWMVEVN